MTVTTPVIFFWEELFNPFFPLCSVGTDVNICSIRLSPLITCSSSSILPSTPVSCKDKELSHGLMLQANTLCLNKKYISGPTNIIFYGIDPMFELLI